MRTGMPSMGGKMDYECRDEMEKEGKTS